MRNFTYHWLHIPSGRRGTSVFMSTFHTLDAAKLEMFEFLNRCTSQNPATWQYWY